MAGQGDSGMNHSARAKRAPCCGFGVERQHSFSANAIEKRGHLSRVRIKSVADCVLLGGGGGRSSLTTLLRVRSNSATYDYPADSPGLLYTCTSC